MESDDAEGARSGVSTVTAPPPAATEAAATPATESNRLKRGVLGPFEVAASTMADIAPAMSFYFGFGFLAATSGVASPLTIIVAGIAVAFLANTLSRYMQAHPSTGSFITFIGMALGPVLAITTAIVLVGGYLVNIFSIMAISGGFMTMFLQNYFHSFPSWTWPIFVCAFVGLAAFLMIRGVHLSTRWAGAFFAFEFIILMLVSIIALIQNGGHLTLHPFNPHYLLSGFKGLAWASRSPSTCSSAGRRPAPWPKRPTSRARTSRVLCLPAWRSCWPASCSSPTPPSRPTARTSAS